MSANVINLIMIIYVVIVIIAIIAIILVTKKKIKKQFVDTLTNLERDKNLIISGSILAELNKVESLINNKELEEKYNYWKSLFKNIKDVDVPKITDDLIDAEELIKVGSNEVINERLALIEFDIFVVKSKANDLLNAIKEITLSEQKNREIVTKLKTEYRTIFLQYNNNNKEDYAMIQNPLELQFENTDKLFSAFELAMQNNVYSEVGKIVKALDDTIGNLKIVIDEAPSIILMGTEMIPKRIEDINKISQKMISEGYNLDYLKLDYNISEAEKKVADVFDRLKVLNLEDSIFELRTILDYFDKLYSDFDKEKISKKLFDEYIRSVILRAKKIKKIVQNLSSKIQEIKYSYDLTDDDIKVIGELDKEANECAEAYEVVMNNFRSKNFAYSKLTKEMEVINDRLNKAEDKLSYTLRSLDSLHEDAVRAHEQKDEIKNLMRQAREHILSYKLPVIPNSYMIQYEEAVDSIREMALELEKKPISIKVLNMRVDTARDLSLKVVQTSINTVKTASMAESAIVYGNRYRAINSNIDNGLSKAERLFFKGEFNAALTEAIKSINVVEPGIQQRLLEAYRNENVK
ncbi:MAG: septation ring formation regulator EzrA [Bacilli bacterium]|nr:septation ring formation regulator EzrA [Bacilli bacterium]